MSRALLPGLEAALRAAARLLLDLVRIERALELREADDARAGGAFGGNARGDCRGADLVGLAAGQRALLRAERELAAARGDVDVAGAAGHGVDVDGNLGVGREAEPGHA